MMNKFEINRDEDGPDFYIRYEYTRKYFQYSNKKWKQEACEFAYNIGYEMTPHLNFGLLFRLHVNLFMVI